jgi:hypothetical protein
MANFNTHIFVAATASGLAAVTLCNKNFMQLLDIPWFVFLGTVGGLLPDIDSDSSRPLKLLFTSLATLMSMLTILAFKDQYILQHLFIIASSTFFIVRYPILAIFKYLTVHRGAIHSLLCAALFSLLMVCINYYLFHNTHYFSWMSGAFIGFGFIVHLLLDEFYSVELGNAQLKRSFGTACKLFSIRYLGVSIMMLIACIFLFLWAPPLPFTVHWPLL